MDSFYRNEVGFDHLYIPQEKKENDVIFDTLPRR
jgi:hypothetical protein